MSDHAKRTRSQLSLSDEIGDIYLGISPLKAARQEWRRNIQVASPLVSSQSHTPPNVPANESDDPSHHKDIPQKRTSPKPESSSEIDAERQLKRLKTDHVEELSYGTETTQPSGPFDFSALRPRNLPSPSDLRQQLGASWTKRAQSAPLMSPSVPHRDLEQLMPSPRKTTLVSPVREALRFSSLPRTLEPLVDHMEVRKVGKSPTESQREKEPTASPVLPASNETDTPLPEKPTPGANTLRPCNDQFAATGPSLVVTASDVSPVSPLLPLDFCPTTPTASSKGQDSDVTPKAIVPSPSSPPGGGLTPVLSSDTLSPLTDAPPSPVSSLSSLSELDHDPSATDSEERASLEPPSRTSREVKPPLSSRITGSKSNHTVIRPVTGFTSTGRERRVIIKPRGSARLTRSSATREKRETGLLQRDSTARQQSTLSVAPGPSSHKQSFSFAMPTSSSLNKTVERPLASSPQKPLSLPKRQPPKLSSPIKPASSIGLGVLSRPSNHTGLSNLSLALEKLKVPPPSRPATTLGFTNDRDSAVHAIGTSKSAPKAKDDSTIRLGNTLPLATRTAAVPLKRAASVGPTASPQPNALAPGSKTTSIITPPSALPSPAGPVSKISLQSGIIVGKSSFSKPRGFVYGGVGRRCPYEKVSKKTSLSVVEASPVKDSKSSRNIGGNPDELPLPSVSHMLSPSVSHEKDDSPVAVAAHPAGVEPMDLQEASTGHVGVPKTDRKIDDSLTDAGEAELPDLWKHASRRASLASQFLQQTLAVLPSTPTPGSSKSTSIVRSQSSSQGTRSGLRSGSSLDLAGPRSAPGAPSNGFDARVHASHSSTATKESSAMKPSSLKVLKSCIIFVDVRTDDGDDAGGLFVDMLRGLGAKIIGRAGQSCTHIVYKNGLMSTLTKYRLMREPKPFVVGISWVVECAEQRKRVEEDNFIVDLEGLNVAGTNKRRRSMLPKHISSNMQTHSMAAPSRPSSSLVGTLMSDQSMDRSSVGADNSLNSSDGFVEDEDDLPPLERARQRRNNFFKR